MNICNICVENKKTKEKHIINFEVNGVVKNEGPIEAIDSYLSQFKSLDDFLTYLLKEGIVSVGLYDCYAVVNGDIKKDVIFNDSFISEKSMERLALKEGPLMDDRTIFDLVNELSDLITTDKDSKNAMCNSKIFPSPVYDKLQRINLADKKDEIVELFKNDLYNILKAHYDMLRDSYIWLKKYKEKKKKIEAYEQLSFTPDQDNYKELLEIAREKANDLKLRYSGISNPTIEYYFMEGGLESVMENCSLEEITSLPVEEQIYIGFKKDQMKR